MSDPVREEERRHAADLFAKMRQRGQQVTQGSPILIDDDGDVDEGFVGTDAELREFFGLDAEPEKDDEGIEGIEFRPVLIEEAAPSTRRRAKAPIKRNAALEEPWESIQEYFFETSRLRVGKSVELRTRENDAKHPQFLAIRQIARNNYTGEVILDGLPLNRVTTLRGMLDGKLNEVHLEIEEDIDDRRPLYEQAMIRVGLHEVLKLRNIKFTHTAFPELSFREHTPLSRRSMTPDEYDTQKQLIKHTGVLVCRIIHITRYANAHERKDKACKGEITLRRLCDGENPLGVTDLRSAKEATRKSSLAGFRPSKVAKFDYSSAFAGLGGDALGALLAGLNALAAFDQDDKACLTFQKNFPHTLSYVQSANAMILMADSALPYSTIWHFSPPCQPWSPAHTKDGKNDWDNIDSLFTVEPFLHKKKPLLVTLEQTAGIVSHHPTFFATLIRILVSAGYNVRWKVAKLEEYGLASKRKRLIIYAVRIGHPLPEFPVKTHGNDEGLLPLVSIGETIRRVPRGADWHLDTVKDYASPRAPYSENSQASCITTKAEVYHPSGRRAFTVRELAALNGFPSNFLFPSRQEINMTDLKKQIGNAVPPLVWKQFMVKVKECLTDFQNGKINELGHPIALRDVTSSVSSAANRMRALSVQAGPSRSRLTPPSRLREMSRTLSPDPPTAEYGTMASSAAEFHATAGSRAGKLKRTLLIDLCQDGDDENNENKEWIRLQKRVKREGGVIDLTADE